MRSIVAAGGPIGSGHGAVGGGPGGKGEGDVEGKVGEMMDGARAVIVGEIYQVQTSCGFGVPMVRREFYAQMNKADERMEEEEGEEEKVVLCRELNVFEERPTLTNYSKKAVKENRLRPYQAEQNARSIDGLPGLTAARRDAGEWVWLGDLAAKLGKVNQEKTSVLVGFLLGVGVYFAGNLVRGRFVR